MNRSVMLVFAIHIMLFCGTVFYATAQYDKNIYSSDTYIEEVDSNGLFVRIENASFLNNREFFNPYQPGYTLIGYYLRPMVEFHAGKNTRLRAGAHLLKYSGLDSFSQAVPVFSIHHRFYRGLDMMFGSLYGALDHDLIEPLFAFDRGFTNHNESGLQFLIDRGFIKADVWLNWEQFIFTGDPFREKFTAGFSSTIKIAGKSQLKVEMPLQFLVFHRGGQIDTSPERMQNLLNYATGIDFTWDMANSVFNSLSFRGYLAGFSDMSGELQYPWDEGWAVYPNFIVRTSRLEAGIGYWTGARFIAPLGEPVFQSVSAVDPEFTEEHRKLLTSKIVYQRGLAKGIDMGLRFEVYYDLPAGRFDHSGGLHIIIDHRFFITKLQRR